MSENDYTTDPGFPHTMAASTQTDTQAEIDAAFEKVRTARAKLIQRRKGRHYNDQQTERNWRKPHSSDDL